MNDKEYFEPKKEESVDLGICDRVYDFNPVTKKYVTCEKKATKVYTEVVEIGDSVEELVDHLCEECYYEIMRKRFET